MLLAGPTSQHCHLKYNKVQSQQMAFTQSPSLSNNPTIFREAVNHYFADFFRWEAAPLFRKYLLRNWVYPPSPLQKVRKSDPGKISPERA